MSGGGISYQTLMVESFRDGLDYAVHKIPALEWDDSLGVLSLEKIDHRRVYR